MADSPVFDHVCEQLEQQTDLDRLAARGTVRISLKTSGLDVSSVDAEQMAVVLRRILPAELESRGVSDAEALCRGMADGLAGMSFDVAQDRASAAARTMARLGGS